MIGVFRMFSHYGSLAAVLCLAAISFFYYTRHKNRESLLLCIGLIAVMIGALIQQIVPFASVSYNEAGEIMAKSGIPLFWYVGSILTTIGLIMTTAGFAFLTFKK